MRIGEVAARSGLAPSAIRFYERQGVLPEPARTSAGYRDYDPSVLSRLAFIRAGQSVGLTLGELQEVIGFRERGEVPCVHVIELIRRRAEEIGEQIDRLQQMRRELTRLSRRAESLDPSDCSPEGICQVIVGSEPAGWPTRRSGRPLSPPRPAPPAWPRSAPGSAS